MLGKVPSSLKFLAQSTTVGRPQLGRAEKRMCSVTREDLGSVTHYDLNAESGASWFRRGSELREVGMLLLSRVPRRGCSRWNKTEQRG